MMNKFKLSVLTIFLLSISLPRIQAQTNVRAYEKYNRTFGDGFIGEISLGLFIGMMDNQGSGRRSRHGGKIFFFDHPVNI